jgi:hypothetical protein
MAAEAELQYEELVNLEHEAVRALQWNTATFFRRVYGDDLVAIAPTGQVMDKQAFIASVESSRAEYSSFIASDVRVRIYPGDRRGHLPLERAGHPQWAPLRLPIARHSCLHSWSAWLGRDRLA